MRKFLQKNGVAEHKLNWTSSLFKNNIKNFLEMLYPVLKVWLFGITVKGRRFFKKKIPSIYVLRLLFYFKHSSVLQFPRLSRCRTMFCQKSDYQRSGMNDVVFPSIRPSDEQLLAFWAIVYLLAVAKRSMWKIWLMQLLDGFSAIFVLKRTY